MSILLALLKVILSTLFGMLPAGIAATVYFAVVNLRAADGPYFPPPLLALVVVIPVALLLVPFQAVVLVWRRVTKRTSLRAGWAVGAMGGVTAGLTLVHGVFASSHQSIGNVLGLVGIALVQGCGTLVCLAYLAQMRSDTDEARA